MKIPTPITTGTSVSWTEPAAMVNGQTLTSTTYSGVVYLRTNVASAGLAISGQPEASGGWDYELTTAQTTGLVAGVWYAEHVISLGAEVFSVGTAQLVVEQSLAFSGNAAAFDGRSQAEKALDAVQQQIDSMIAGGVQMYMIGNRQMQKIPLSQLYKERNRLQRIVNNEKAAANGVTDPTLMLGVFQ